MPNQSFLAFTSMQTVTDMENARKKTSIDVSATRNLLWGGQDNWERHEEIAKILENDPVFDKATRHFLNRTEAFKRGLRLTRRVFELEEEYKWTRDELNLAFNMIDESLPIQLHLSAFEPVLNSQGSPSLLDKVSHLVARRAILGCYLQTELGHGSNVAGLETTATFIPETQEFDIHSPTLTSSKWWIGALGRVSTHGVVQAKLILPGGRDVGPHLFFVQLRDLETHKLLPGIEAGDIGPKVMSGYAPVDNGYARFHHVRVPKENMLSKFADVTPEGRYVKPPHAKMSYGGMLYIRSSMVTHAALATAKAITIAIRYTIVRRQGDKGSDNLERQVLTYPSTYYRLLPILSRAYVFLLLGQTLQISFAEHSKRISTGDTSLLADMHAILSGLKSYATSVSIADIEMSRRSMGGHGFSAFSGVGKLYADILPSLTYEGENYVLDKQVVRAAVKAQQSTQQLSSPSSFAAFLRLQEAPVVTPSTWETPSALALLLEWRAAVLVRQIKPEDDAGFERRVSKGVTEAFIATQIEAMVSMSESIKGAAVLRALYTLFMLSTIESSMSDFLEFAILTPAHALEVRRSLRNACIEILPEAVGLTDAFGYSDWELDSALGVYDGRVYESLWQKAQLEPLNQREHDDVYKDYIRPILIGGRARL